MEKIEVTTQEQLDSLYEESALTLEGLSEESIPDFLGWIKNYTEIKNETVFIIKGSVMNEKYNLKGNNAYPEDLTIVCIKLTDLSEPSRIVMPRFQIGGRWFDDVVDNNRAREEGR